MFYPDRQFRVAAENDPGELARKLTKQTWPSDTAFEHGGHLYVNDSTVGDESQDYAVFKNQPDASGKYVQVKGFPFGWMDAAEALTVIRDITRGAYDDLILSQHELRLGRPATDNRSQ